MSIDPGRPASIHHHRFGQYALGVVAVLATLAVVIGITLGTAGFVRTTQLAEQNKTNLSIQCDAQQIVIKNQARGIHDGAKLFAPLFADEPQKLKKAIKESRKDLRELKRVRARLHCPPARQEAHTSFPMPSPRKPHNGEVIIPAALLRLVL